MSRDQELPIDINYQKLIEWMVTRNKLPNDWHKRVQAIQGKIAEARVALPPSLLQRILGSMDAGIDYFSASAISSELMQSTDRSIFGSATGEAAIWEKIVKAYVKNTLYLGEAAQALVQSVDYDVPYLRGQASKFHQQIQDLERKHADCLKNAAACAANYKKDCEKLGILGLDVQAELAALANELPPLLADLLLCLRAPAISDAISFYSKFTEYAHPGAEVAASGILTTLHEVREGTTAALEEVAGAAEGVLQVATGTESFPAASAPAINRELGGANDGQVTEGADEAGAAADAINWNLDVPAAAAAAAAGGGEQGIGEREIEWELGGEEQEDAEGSGQRAGEASPGVIDWDIDLSQVALEGSGVDGVEESAEASQSRPGADEGAASANMASKGEGALLEGPDGRVLRRLQGDGEYRGCMVADLEELHAFIITRRAGVAGGGTDWFMAVAPEELQRTDATALDKMREEVEAALAALNAGRVRQMLMVGSSRRYAERLTQTLRLKGGQEAKMVAAAQGIARKQQEARKGLVGVQPKLEGVVGRVKELKRQIEEGMGRILGGRKINLQGELNSIIAGVQR